VVNVRQEIATAKNIDGLPPFGYAEFTGKIPFGG
jgi:hypothetical protein